MGRRIDGGLETMRNQAESTQNATPGEILHSLLDCMVSCLRVSLL
jgi:hypothetical protein